MKQIQMCYSFVLIQHSTKLRLILRPFLDSVTTGPSFLLLLTKAAEVEQITLISFIKLLLTQASVIIIISAVIIIVKFVIETFIIIITGAVELPSRTFLIYYCVIHAKFTTSFVSYPNVSLNFRENFIKFGINFIKFKENIVKLSDYFIKKLNFHDAH